jgi:hypothetical protein
MSQFAEEFFELHWALPPYIERPATSDNAVRSRLILVGDADDDDATDSEPPAARASGLKRIDEGDDSLRGVHWSSDSWAQRAARRQESVPPAPVDGDDERVVAWVDPSW